MSYEEKKKKIKEDILDSLFKHCKDKTHTSIDVMSKLLCDLNKTPKVDTEDKILEIIRVYKNSRENLELTIDLLYDILYPPVPKTESGDKKTDNNDDSGFDYT